MVRLGANFLTDAHLMSRMTCILHLPRDSPVWFSTTGEDGQYNSGFNRVARKLPHCGQDTVLFQSAGIQLQLSSSTSTRRDGGVLWLDPNRIVLQMSIKISIIKIFLLTFGVKSGIISAENKTTAVMGSANSPSPAQVP